MNYDFCVNEENRRIRRLRRTIDLVGVALSCEPITIDEALDLVNFARRQTLELFPGTEDKFSLIYAPRLNRIIAERFGGRISSGDGIESAVHQRGE
ncbi:MAG: hypothetical protein J7M12_03585 [Candidatus Hydrogenedentes bacterium]|nr:hypothetical protein [Candidatus Hydrogenedentota bacterium]